MHALLTANVCIIRAYLPLLVVGPPVAFYFQTSRFINNSAWTRRGGSLRLANSVGRPGLPILGRSAMPHTTAACAYSSDLSSLRYHPLPIGVSLACLLRCTCCLAAVRYSYTRYGTAGENAGGHSADMLPPDFIACYLNVGVTALKK